MKTFEKDTVEPVPCRGCGRLMFPPSSPYRDKYIEMGALVAHTSQGYCGACRDRVRRRTKTPLGEDIRIYTPIQTECIECSRPIRSCHTHKEDHPGTVLAGRRSMCTRCYRNMT